ncbi:multicopper oxidase [Catovirus CTV1]|uniref:Multicopper oxidase n=1 Tax=Catovirus CTV1 TaxID=1977631 RepID=A0A1V0S9F1_9VIRU|nr:multicopper oxidase [Catovirus CTV1]
MHNHVKLPQPQLIDFSKFDKNDDIKIVIKNTKHKFASDAKYSGTDVMKQPIFGSKVYVNGKKIQKLTYGLPFMRFHQNSTPTITFENKTKYTFNIHQHGLNTVGSTDGVSSEVFIGNSTILGPKVTFQYPKITNNSSLLWFHGHNMFVSMELIYAGIVGLLQIVDSKTKCLTEKFEYGNNNILLEALDMDLTDKGTQTFENLTTFFGRSNFTVINGISAVNWYSNKKVPYVDSLYHTTTKNLVKIDILNASINSRVFYLGVCDEDKTIKSFYQVQVDSGLLNPNKRKILAVPVVSRMGIVIDLLKFKNHKAYLFFYNFDLTEIFGTNLTYPNEPNNTTLTATIPDMINVKNATPFPTPIPDPNQQNQQQDYSNLNYPIVPLIPQVQQVLNNGNIKIPQRYTIKPFLKIIMDGNEKISLDDTITQIREIVFGKKNYHKNKTIIDQSGFEYNNSINYLSLLNKKYFYNLPKISDKIVNPVRNLLLFSEGSGNVNTIANGNIYGTTEYVNGTIRIMCDLWNSSELDTDWALKQYKLDPNNYKPSTLPSSKFRIYKTNDEYSNTAMISNDTLLIEFFEDEVAYGDTTKIPLSSITVIFPPTPSNKLLNIQEWINTANDTFSNTMVNISGNDVRLSDIIYCDWAFFPYEYDFMYQKTLYIKSAVIKTTNYSDYWIRFLARWPLLQFFGKPMTGNNLPASNNSNTDFISKQKRKHKNVLYNNLNRLPPIKNDSQYIRCDEVGIYGIYDAEIQQIFPFYATSDGNVQLPVACMKRNAELIIEPIQTYIGLYDGYLNDNLNSFSVKLNSTEKWVYTNGDTNDSHPLHFHMTSGFTSVHSTYNSANLVNSKRSYDPLIYSRDIYQVGPQEIVSFDLTWPYYSSYDQTETPNLTGIGAVVHCHYLLHNDSNAMIVQYFIDP